jgi:hypothetical protein
LRKGTYPFPRQQCSDSEIVAQLWTRAGATMVVLLEA